MVGKMCLITPRKIFGLSNQNLVKSSKEFTYHTVVKIFVNSTKDGFFRYDLVEWNKYLSWFKQILHNLIKYLVSFNKMLWLNQVNFFFGL